LNPPARSAGKPCRLDRALVQRGLAPTRSRAQALILAGRVFSGTERMDKPGTRIRPDRDLRVEAGPRFVGRGGYKLHGALDTFGIDVRGLDALDVGASTGGFTQVLLEGGASRVIALDVGRGQLDWSLRNDPRVVVLEGVNARHLSPGDLPFRPAIAVLDVSFISLELVLDPVASCLLPPGRLVALVKPQFEAGRGRVGKGGIVRDPAVHREVLDRLLWFCGHRGWGILGVAASPIRGAEGNVEFFLDIAPGGETADGFDAAAALDAAVRAGIGDEGGTSTEGA
jgi:23S rRNA (cytidine1920-2'-O)/16S rRNA (cytidine1409-2'-O)-methyltransferase